MLLLTPTATFGSIILADLTAATISRTPKRIIADHSDTGPHVAFADVPEFQTLIRLVGRVLKDDVNLLAPGQAATLEITTAATGSDRPRRRLAAASTLVDVKYDFTDAKGCTRTLEFLATSDGNSDPISITDA